MVRYPILLFDADGTLLDFEQTEADALTETFRKFSLPLDGRIRKRYLEINHGLWKAFENGEITKAQVLNTRFAQLFRELNLNGPTDGTFERCYQDALAYGHALMPDALEVCRNLSRCHELYIVSNGVSSTQFKRLDESGLRPFMKQVFVSEDVGYQKPMKEYFDYVERHISGFDRKNALMIGDSLASDIRGGMMAGIDTCWYNPGCLAGGGQVKPDYEIRDLKELYEICG